MKRIPAQLARALGLLLLALALLAGGCSDGSDGTKPTGREKLPELVLTDQTPDLLLSWLDERGGSHTGVSISEVPEALRAQVRVITKDAGNGSTFYVADLRKKSADGRYSISTMARVDWEQKEQSSGHFPLFTFCSRCSETVFPKYFFRMR